MTLPTPPASLGDPSWRPHPENNVVATMPVVSLGDGSQRVKPTTVSVVTPPATTGAPGWHPSRAD